MGDRAHLRATLALLALFVASGLWLEANLGLRLAGITADPLRREFLRLGHAHGGVLAILNLGLAFAMDRLQTPAAWARKIRWASLTGVVLVAGGFVVGGLTHGPTDPGPAVLVVPAGAMCLLLALCAAAVLRSDDRDL